MNTPEDDDIKLQRASASLLSDFGKLLAKILRKRNRDSSHAKVHRRVRETDLHRAFALIQPFQEDPQLLDSHLKNIIPPLVAAYLDSLQVSPRPEPKKHLVPLTHAICRILNLFCKVRGEKVVKGFLNNEPRYLEPILHEFEKGENFLNREEESASQTIVPWEERYILLLWLSHLMLAPFPLASISALQSSRETAIALGIDLPTEISGVTLRCLTICANGLKSATKERSAAANLLVRLSVRPDMQKLGLLNTLVKWSLSFFSQTSESISEIHPCLGILSFLSGLVSSATNAEIGPFLPAVYQACQNIISQDTLLFVRSSAVARKLVVKTLRNIVVHCLQAPTTHNGLDMTSVLEEAIEFLLKALADGDTPVRYAASKALSVITIKIDPEMAGDIIEAILSSLTESVYWQGSKRNLSGVNPLRWHGLTLTLSHLLYRRALSTDQLPDILNALLLALAFEQRSATGGSIGTNVRDAACFGIWALSRRYATKDLLAVETASIRASHRHHQSLSIPQVLAIELLVVACLDPAGNIRRGSSAALQELIGRHPNTVEEGIPLVQIVDFHAVGLRERAMCEVAVKAGQLHQMYWEALLENLMEWRGTGSLDTPSRVFAASAVGYLVENQLSTVTWKVSDQIIDRLRALKPREVEERHGLVMSLSALVNQVREQKLVKSTAEISTADVGTDLACQNSLWGLLNSVLKLEDKAFTSPTLRPELTASSICNFLGAMATLSYQDAGNRDLPIFPVDEVVRLLNLCLGRTEDSVLQAIPVTARSVLQLLSTISASTKENIISTWLEYLEHESSYNGLRGSGYTIALGAVYSLLSDTSSNNTAPTPTDVQLRIVKVLTFRCTSDVGIAARPVALQALEVLLKNYFNHIPTTPLGQDVIDRIGNALHVALNDYTITERGDVGSLVRLEALTTTGTAWTAGLIVDSKDNQELHADVLRLSLEKLDKVRARAAHVLEKGYHEHFEKAIQRASHGVSSYAYFASALKILRPSTLRCIKEAVLLGFISSAGMGSESVVQNSRMVLVDTLDALPLSTSGDDRTNEKLFTLLDFANCLTDLLKAASTNDRVLIPLLEVLAFLFDMQIMHRLVETPFR
ncbi:hypothetical protein K469DRAFT_703633, partial [Zopfia rhizophila CBS 207.26]